MDYKAGYNAWLNAKELEADLRAELEGIRCDEKEQEERLHSQWVTMLPKMSTKELKYVSFNEYVDQCTGRNIDTRTSEEIIAELEELHGMKLV